MSPPLRLSFRPLSEEFASSPDQLTMKELHESVSSNPAFPAFTAAVSTLLSAGCFPQLPEQSTSEDDEDVIPVPLEDFLKARGADDCLMDKEETERQKIAHQKYMQLHNAVDYKLDEYVLQAEILLDRLRTTRPLLPGERRRRTDLVKIPFYSLKRKINHAFVDVPGSYTSKRRKRGALPKAAVRVLKKWLFDHFSHPYPSVEEKEALSAETGLKTAQVNYWFINARVRIWKPMIATMNSAT